MSDTVKSPETNDNSTRSSSVFERHFQTAITSLLVLACGWMGNTLQDTSLTVARLTVQIENLNEKMQDAYADRYTTTQAYSDLALRDSRILEIERRVSILEKEN